MRLGAKILISVLCLFFMGTVQPKINKFYPPILAPLLKKAAMEYDINVDLLCAVIHQESGGNPWASRFEPDFYSKYIKNKVAKDLPGHFPSVHVTTPQTEYFNRSKSYGLFQIMGNTARLHGFQGDFLDELFDIPTNVDLGAKILKDMISKTNSVEEALLRWNGGGNKDYPKKVLEILSSGKAHYLLRV